MGEDPRIEDKSLAEEMAYAEKPIRDTSLAETQAAAAAIQKKFSERQSIEKGFEGQSRVLIDRILETPDLPEQVTQLFKNPMSMQAFNSEFLKSQLGDQKGLRISGFEPAPDRSSAQMNRQFDAVILPKIIDHLKPEVLLNRTVGSDGNIREDWSTHYDPFTLKFPDLPNVGVRVGVITRDLMISTAKQLHNGDPNLVKLPEIFGRTGAKVFQFDIVPLASPVK